MTTREWFVFLFVIIVVLVCFAILPTPSSAADIQTMDIPANQSLEMARRGRGIGGKILGPRGGSIGGAIVGPGRRGEEGLKHLNPDWSKFSAPSPIRVAGSLFHLTLQIARITLDLIVVALFLYLVYKGVRRAKGKETRLADTIEKIKAKRAVVVAKLKAQRDELTARINAAEEKPDA